MQVKRLQSTVKADGLRSFLAQLGEDDVGSFVCIGGLTKDATQEEARSEKKRKNNPRAEPTASRLVAQSRNGPEP